MIYWSHILNVQWDFFFAFDPSSSKEPWQHLGTRSRTLVHLDLFDRFLTASDDLNFPRDKVDINILHVPHESLWKFIQEDYLCVHLYSPFLLLFIQSQAATLPPCAQSLLATKYKKLTLSAVVQPDAALHKPPQPICHLSQDVDRPPPSRSFHPRCQPIASLP